MFEEKKINSKCVYNGRIIDVFYDEVMLPDNTKSFREVVRHNGGVTVLAINDDKIVMVQQFRYPINKLTLELPAGKLEKNENPLECAKRELEEETGFIADNWESLGYIDPSAGFSDEKLYLYKATNLTQKAPIKIEGEFINFMEIDKKEVINKVNNGEINDAKTICALFRGLNND